MNDYPPNKILFTLLFLIILGFGLFHFSTIKSTFYQLQFDWKKKQVIETIDIKSVKDFSSNTLTIINDNPNIKLDNQFTYSIKSDQEYYFRFNYSTQTNDILKLSDLVWITDIPTNLNNVKNISKIDLPLKQSSKDKIIVMIGNELIYSNEAKYLRKEIKKVKDVRFVGDIKDIYNNSFIDIDNQNFTIPNSVDYIIIFSDSYPDTFYEKLNKTLENNPIKLILIKNPELNNDHVNNFDATKLNKNITPINIDPNTIFNKNASIFYYDNNKHLTLEAYQKIAVLISKEIE